MTPSRARRAGTPAATLAQVKALADPLRYRVFENLLAEPRTAKQMAERLGTHPTRLYHHFRVLEKAGLIRPAGTRQKRGTTEKYFKAAVDRIEARAESGGLPAALAGALFEGVLGSTLADVRDSGRSRPGDGPAAAAPYLKRYRIRATAEQAADIQARLEELSALCERASASDADAEFGVTLAFHAIPDTATRRKRR
jgi:DNA-binding transcriptional ArsR family regulator